MTPIQFAKDKGLNLTIGCVPWEGTPIVPGTNCRALQDCHMNEMASLVSALVVGPHAGDQGQGETVLGPQQGCSSANVIRIIPLLGHKQRMGCGAGEKDPLLFTWEPILETVCIKMEDLDHPLKCCTEIHFIAARWPHH